MTANTNEVFLIKRSKAKLTLMFKSTTIKNVWSLKPENISSIPILVKYSLFPYYKTTLWTISALWPKKAELYFQNCDIRKLFKSKVSHSTISHNAEVARDANLIRYRIMTKKTFSHCDPKKLSLISKIVMFYNFLCQNFPLTR